MFINLKVNDNARVRLATSIATITTLKPGTDFVICHNAVKLTCIVVLEGEVEVVGQGKLVTVKGGEATYILKDSPPFPAICGNNQEVLAMKYIRTTIQSILLAVIFALAVSGCSAPTPTLKPAAPATAAPTQTQAPIVPNTASTPTPTPTAEAAPVAEVAVPVPEKGVLYTDDFTDPNNGCGKIRAPTRAGSPCATWSRLAR